MAMKAKKKTTKKDKPAHKTAIYDLDDSNWWRLARVYRELLPQLGKLTRKALTEARESGKLRCVRLLNSGQCKPTGAKFWRSLKPHEKPYFDRPDKYDPDVYVWRPWEVLPVSVPHAAKESEPEESERGKPGPRPKKDWKWFIAHRLCELRKAGKSETAADLAELCQRELKYLPDESAINTLRKGLQRLLD
jgi:hypothetical protein